jgi:carboxypeptidase C (cathepsin A)
MSTQIATCNTNLTDAACSETQQYCNNYVLGPLSGDYDVYDVRTVNPDPYPPEFDNLLNTNATLARIGAEKEWEESNFDVYVNFALTGDWMRTKRPALESVIDAGVRTILFDGDADYICNYKGFEALADGLQTRFTKQYARTKWSSWKVNGQLAGQYRNAGTFSYLRVYGAGHEVPAYKYGAFFVH